MRRAPYIEFKVDRRCYLVASRTACAFFLAGPADSMDCVIRLENPEARSRGQKPGGDRAERSTWRRDKVATHFSRRIAENAKHLQNMRGFEELILVAEPKFLGLLRQELPASVKARIREEIQSDRTQLSDPALKKYLREQAASSRASSSGRDALE